MAKQLKSISEYEQIALVLQGGGALGAYQAGVVEGLTQQGVEPSWIAGISIGALNTAIIAGNPPEQRVAALRAFWLGCVDAVDSRYGRYRAHLCQWV